MKRGSVLIITLGVITVLFLISIFILSIVTHKLNVLKFEQKKLLVHNIARSAAFTMFNNLDLFTSDSTLVSFEIPNFNGKVFCTLVESEALTATVTCTAEIDNLKNSLTFSVRRYLLSFALAVNTDLIIGNNTTVYGDILVTYAVPETTLQKIDFIDGTYYRTSQINAIIDSTPGNLLPASDLILNNGEIYTITAPASNHYNLISVDNNSKLIFDTTNGNIILTVDKLSFDEPKNANKANFVLRGNGLAIIYVESIDPVKNKFLIEKEGEAKLLIFSEKDVTFELKNKGTLENVYFYLPYGHFVAKNSLTIQGSFVLDSFEAQNNSNITFIPPKTNFFYIKEADETGNKFKLLGWIP